MAKHEELDVGETDLEGANKREREEEESGDKEEGYEEEESESVGDDDSENADDDEDSKNSEEDSDFDSDTGEIDNVGDWLDLSEFEDEDMPEKIPTSMAFPASLLRYVQEKHNPRPSDDTVLVNIVEDDEGLAREDSYSVWEMKSQNRKIKMVRISMSLRILMVVECCLAISDRTDKKEQGKEE